jgi:hypothetical protein
MRDKYNFAEVKIGFACTEELDEKIISECRRLCDTKSGVIRRALLYYFENLKTKGEF